MVFPVVGAAKYSDDWGDPRGQGRASLAGVRRTAPNRSDTTRRERLMTQDKVDFVLPPWSTGFNLAAAPIYARNGYPQLAVTANTIPPGLATLVVTFG